MINRKTKRLVKKILKEKRDMYSPQELAYMEIQLELRKRLKKEKKDKLRKEKGFTND